MYVLFKRVNCGALCRFPGALRFYVHAFVGYRSMARQFARGYPGTSPVVDDYNCCLPRHDVAGAANEVVGGAFRYFFVAQVRRRPRMDDCVLGFFALMR